MTNKKAVLGARLREERRRLGMTQAALAAVAGISTTTQIGYEAGTTDPGATYLQRIAAAGVDVLFVLTDQRVVEKRDIDFHLLIGIVHAIDEWAASRNKTTTSETRAHLVALVYQHCSRDGVINPSFVEMAVKIAG